MAITILFTTSRRDAVCHQAAGGPCIKGLVRLLRPSCCIEWPGGGQNCAGQWPALRQKCPSPMARGWLSQAPCVSQVPGARGPLYA
eukprot:2973818-Heterocapsa_arctica.AAC.1